MSKLPDPYPSLRGELADIRRQLRRMQSASPFFGNSPTLPGTLYAARTNFALTTTLSTILTATVTVPATLSSAAVAVSGRCYAVNGTTALDYLYAQTGIAGFSGYALPLAVSANGGSGTNASSFSVVLQDLVPGSTFTVQLAASTAGAAWTANAGNTAELSGSIQWFR